MLLTTTLIIVILETLTSSAEVQRVPDDVIPTMYDLNLKVDTGAAPIISGNVAISITCKETTRAITVNAKVKHGLFVPKEVDVYQLFGKNEKVTVTKTTYSSINESIIIELENDLEQGKDYVLKLSFRKTIAYPEPDAGLLVINRNGKFSIMADFLRSDARNVFPCFDGPAIRAKFRLTIERRDEAVSFSNTKIARTRPGSAGWTTDIYSETLLLSPYQVSFFVSEVVQSKAEFIFGSIPVTFWIDKSIPERNPECQLSFAKLQLFLNTFEMQGIVPPSVDKIDYIFIPSEGLRIDSLGLTFMSESDYLSCGTNDEYLTYSVYLGLAKQWFGASLNPLSWKFEWLLHSLAAYVPIFLLSDRYKQEVIVPRIFSVMQRDSWPNSKDLNMVESGDVGASELSLEVLEKGTMLIRMAHKMLGDTAFLQGVNKFSIEYTARSVTVNDFWKILDAYSKNPRGMFQSTNVEMIPSDVGMTTIMNSWTDQPGYPLIIVRRDGTNIKVSQIRFYTNLHGNVDLEKIPCWWIPLTFTTSSKPGNFENTETTHWLGCNSKYPQKIVLRNVVKEEDWIIFNNQLSGLYRVQYDEVSWELIIFTLDDPKTFSEIHPYNRAQLVNDALTLSYEELLDYDITFRLLLYLEHETDLFVWKSFFTSVATLDDTLRRSRHASGFKVFMGCILNHVYNTIFPTKEAVLRYIDNNLSTDNASTKLDIHEASCRFNVPECLLHSREIFALWQGTDFKLQQNLKEFPTALTVSVLCGTLQNALSPVEFRIIFNKVLRLKKEDTNRHIFIEALKCSSLPSSVVKVLTWCTSGSCTDDIDEKILTFNQLLAEEETFLPALEFFYHYINEINLYYSKCLPSDVDSPLKGLVTTMACEMNAPQLAELKGFIRSSKVLNHWVKIEDLKECEDYFKRKVKWMDRNSPSIGRVLLRYFRKA